MKTKLFIGFFFAAFSLNAQTSAPSAALQATENEALLQVTVSNMEDVPRAKDIILFEGNTNGLSIRGISDANGKFAVLLPEGDIYTIKIQGLGDTSDFDQIEIPAQEGKISGSIGIRYEPARSFTLDDVHFDSGKASLRSSSFAALDEIVEVLKIKDTMILEIGGHTDNVGGEVYNLELSQARAEAVVKYLISKGINAKQLTAKGYGQSQPIADNASPEGRQANRRTEARIVNYE